MMTVDEEMVEYVKEMVKKFGTGKVLETSEIVREVSFIYGRTKGSIIPSDYCYNRVNNGINLNKPTLFVYRDRNQYECVGLDYPYNGDIYHKPKGEKVEIRVGKCINGKRSIAHDSNFDAQSATNPTKRKINSHKTNREPSMKLRFDVLKRDKFKCCMCGASPAKDASIELHIDHIVPWSKGGETVINNLQTLCSKCNLGKRDSFV